MKRYFKLSRVAAALSVVGGVSLYSAASQAAQLPAAGESISNVATASYVDSTGSERTVTSNMVKTIVAQIGSFTLVADRESQTAANSTVSFSHTLTNTGNGRDTFHLTLENLVPTSGSVFDFSEINVYLDKNSDGLPDGQPIITYVANGTNKTVTPIQLDANESTGILIIAKTPASAVANQLDKLRITASSVGFASTAANVSNTDTAYIRTGAIVQIEKSASASNITVNSEIVYTIKFYNKGTATTEDNVTIYDFIPDNVQLESVTYNGTEYKTTNVGAYQYKKDAATGKEVFLLNVGKLSAGQTGQLVLTVKVKDQFGSANTKVVDGDKISNTAYADTDSKHEDSPLTVDNVPSTPPSPSTDSTVVSSNTNTVTVQGVFSGAINDSELNAWKDGTTAPSGADDIILTTAKQGESIVFGGALAAVGNRIYVHNSGNTADSYNLSIDKTAFGTDSMVEFLQSDGRSPLISNNTGTIAPGAKLEIVVRITLASGKQLTIPATPGYLESVVTSTSVKHSTNKDTIKLRLTAFTQSNVDVVHKDSSNTEHGKGEYTGSQVIPSTTVKPGITSYIDVTVKNTGSTPDNYNINLPTIPDKWTVEIFKKQNGSCTSEKVPNTGNIAAGSEQSFCLAVTAPADSLATDPTAPIKIPVEVTSPSSGVKDRIEYPVIVDQVRILKFTQDRSNQVSIGGSVIYEHTLTNYGNVLEGATNTGLELSLSAATKGEIVTIYIDKNNDGVIDPATELWTGTNLSSLLQATRGAGDVASENGLSPRESVTIFVKVEAPKTAAVGDSYTTTVTVVPASATKFETASSVFAITDLTTVIEEGLVALAKTQALSANCTTVPTVFSATEITAKPGECVYYRIVATNQSKSNAKNVTIYDTVPSFTTYKTGSATAKLDGVDAAASTIQISSNGRQVSYTLASDLPTTKTAELKFAVKLDDLQTP